MPGPPKTSMISAGVRCVMPEKMHPYWVCVNTQIVRRAPIMGVARFGHASQKFSQAQVPTNEDRNGHAGV